MYSKKIKINLYLVYKIKYRYLRCKVQNLSFLKCILDLKQMLTVDIPYLLYKVKKIIWLINDCNVFWLLLSIILICVTFKMSIIIIKKIFNSITLSYFQVHYKSQI